MSLILSALDGRVVLKGFLGEGGMGQVHRAWDQALERAVAVKFLRGTDPREAERLLLEARLQARVEHPHVVKVHEVGTLEGRPCIVLQLVEGRSLAALAPELTQEAKVELVRQAAEGLHAAHRQGLLHRDIKPANILVEETPGGRRALVSDFGLARDQEVGQSRGAFPAGTLDFMSPEQLLSQGPLGLQSDVYALGATLYCVLAGRYPFRDSLKATSPDRDTPHSQTGHEDPAQLLRRILEEEPASLAVVIPGLPRELPLIVAKAMAKEPSLRYTTAEAFAEDLGRFQRGEAILAHAPGAVEQLQKWAHRNRMAARITLGAAALLVLGLGYTAFAARRATRRALDSARMGGRAAAMEYALTREYLLPSHDLRPALQALRQQLVALAADTSGAEAPRAYALGRGYQLLEEWPEARVQLERARTLGFRTPEGELAYGLVLAELYQQGLRQARTIPDKAQQQKRLEALRQELLIPAVAAIQAQVQAMPEHAHSLLGQVALMEGRLDEALGHARAAQAKPQEQAEGLLLEAKVIEEQRQILYVRHAHQEALVALTAARQALEAVQHIARSDPRAAEGLVQCSLLGASHLRSLGQPTTEALAQAQTDLDAARALHGDEGRLAVLEATLLQRLGMTKKDVGQSAVQEDTRALQLLREAAAQHPGNLELQRFLVNGWYSYCYAKVAAGENPGDSFTEGYLAVDSAQRLAPQDWRIPYTGSLLAYPQSLYLNNRGLDARATALRGVRYAEQALSLGAAANARGSRADCRAELAKAQYAAGEDPRSAIAQLLEDNTQSLLLAPADQILRINSAASAIQAAHLLQRLAADAGPTLALAASWSQGNNPKYLEAQRNLLDIQLLQRHNASEPAAAELQACLALNRDCQAMEKQFKTVLPFQCGSALVLVARAQARSGADPSSAFHEAQQRFLKMEQEDPGNVQAPAESALAGLEEARWRLSRNLPVAPALAVVRAAQARSRRVQPEQALLLALEAAALGLEAEHAVPDLQRSLLQQAKALWAEALKRNANLKLHPAFARTLAQLA